MNTTLVLTPSWSTASFGNAIAGSDNDLSALEAHLAICRALHGRTFALQCAAEAMSSFVTARFVTTMAAVTLIIGVTSLVL
jgi:hypothetical protein